MRIKRLFCFVLTVIFILFAVCGCNDTQKYVLYMELNDKPDTLDPQLASGTTEELLTKNLFEGLMRCDANGDITYGAAESHTISNNGCVYTFKISEHAKWQNGDLVTANDFVFAFTRAVDPKIKAPAVSALYQIVGAKQMSQGKQAKLGVTAIDETTLQIELISPDPNFLKILTTSITMPCHKATFEKAKGQYGKTGEHLLCNGSYRLRYWTKDGTFSLRLNKNEAYEGNFPSEAVAVMFSAGERTGRAKRIDDENLDIGLIDRGEATDQSNLFTFEKTCYALVINRHSQFSSKEFRTAFAAAIHRNRLKTELPVSFTESGCLIPSTVLLNKKPLNTQCTITIPAKYNPELAHKTYVSAAKQTDKLPNVIEILYYGNEDVAALTRLVAEGFQQSLGAVVNIKPTESEAALFTALRQKEYQFAIVPITAQSEDPAQFFEQFTSKAGERNYFGFKNNSYDKAVAKITKTAGENTITSATEQAVNLIIKDGHIIPLAHYSEAFAYGKSFSCPTISPFGGILDLALIRKNG